VLRLAVLVVEHLGRQPGFNDSPYYSRQAAGLLRGVWFQDPRTGGPSAEHGPLTAIALAPFSWADEPMDHQRLGSVLVGLAVIAVIGLVGRRLAGDRAGLVAAGVAALYPNLWMNDGLVMSENVGGLTVAGWALAGLRWGADRSWPRALVWGALGGLATLARSELALLVVAAAILVVAAGSRPRTWRQAALVLVGAGLVAGPWVGWNMVRFERPVMLTTNEGTTIRGANCDETYVGEAIGSWSVGCLVLDGGATAALEPSVRSAVWRQEGLAYAWDNAERLPVVVAARAARMLDLYAVGHMVDEDVRDDRPRWASWLGVFSWWVLAPVAVVGLARARGLDRAVLLTPVVIVAVTSVLFYGGHRLRSPLEPVVPVAVAQVLVSVGSSPGRRWVWDPAPRGQ
jgi:hypothetical protein